MPTYEFRCRTCDTLFEERRPMEAASDPARCPAGHDDTVRLLSMFASVTSGRAAPAPAPTPVGGGGCCGGASGCH